jgi:hypothetical protein
LPFPRMTQFFRLHSCEAKLQVKAIRAVHLSSFRVVATVL